MYSRSEYPLTVRGPASTVFVRISAENDSMAAPSQKNRRGLKTQRSALSLYHFAEKVATVSAVRRVSKNGAEFISAGFRGKKDRQGKLCSGRLVLSVFKKQPGQTAPAIVFVALLFCCDPIILQFRSCCHAAVLLQLRSRRLPGRARFYPSTTFLKFFLPRFTTRPAAICSFV